MRVGILSLIHESNTFAVTPTTIDMFRRDGLLIGDDVRRAYEGGHNQISGFLAHLKGTGIEAVPIFHASTPPSGTITRETCEELVRLMFAALDEAGELDGYLVSPHGANAGEGDDYRDLDGFWLTRLRERVGETPPIICVIDPHANLSARMVDAAFDYTYEYQGNGPKLVHTPLTDKCYLTLTQGMWMGFGGSPYGPAGTGKTESVKALGACFGRQVLVFNCDEGIDFHSMGRIFTGLVKCGAWGCFDEFNRLKEDQLSAVSQQIQIRLYP